MTPAATVHEVADRVFACEQPDGPRLIRQVVIAGDEAALVVDTGLPGAPADGILPVLERLGLPPIILLTHPDGDHVAGTAEVLAAYPARARTLGGAADLPLLGDPARAIRERYARFSQHRRRAVHRTTWSAVRWSGSADRSRRRRRRPTACRSTSAAAA